MSGYDIILSDGDLLTTVNVKTVDNQQSSPLFLIGQGIPNYGTMVAQDFIWMLENFSNSTPPVNPLEGMLWYNKSAQGASLYNGTDWSPIMAGPSSSITGHLSVFANDVGSLIDDPSTETFPVPASTPIDLAVFSVGPGSAAITEIPVGVVQGIVSKMLVPSSYTQAPWPNTNFSAYLVNENNLQPGASAVSYFSTAIVGANGGSSVWNFNSIGTNVPSDPWGATPGAGVNFGIINGIELDFNICKVGSAQPVGQCNAIAINGASEPGVEPQQDSFAIHIYGLNGAPLLSDPSLTPAPWNFGLCTEAGATICAISMGAVAPGPSQASQFLQVLSTDSGGGELSSIFFGNPQGDFAFIPSSGLVTSPGFSATTTGYSLLTDLGMEQILYYGDDQIIINDAAQHQAIIIQGAPSTAETFYRNTSHLFQTIAGAGSLMTLTSPADTTGLTALYLGVVNNAGYNVPAVTLGAPNSGGTGFRALVVPN